MYRIVEKNDGSRFWLYRIQKRVMFVWFTLDESTFIQDAGGVKSHGYKLSVERMIEMSNRKSTKVIYSCIEYLSKEQ